MIGFYAAAHKSVLVVLQEAMTSSIDFCSYHEDVSNYLAIAICKLLIARSVNDSKLIFYVISQ
jgi:hypothetical protein